jgi:hypothetical protein
VDKQMQEFETLLVCRRRLLEALLSRQSLLTIVSEPEVDSWLSLASAGKPPAVVTRLQNTVAALGKSFPSTAEVKPAAATPGQSPRPGSRPASRLDRLSATTLPRALTLSETHELFEGLDARPLCADCKQSPMLSGFFLEAFSPKPPISDRDCPLCLLSITADASSPVSPAAPAAPPSAGHKRRTSRTAGSQATLSKRGNAVSGHKHRHYHHKGNSLKNADASSPVDHAAPAASSSADRDSR